MRSLSHDTRQCGQLRCLCSFFGLLFLLLGTTPLETSAGSSDGSETVPALIEALTDDSLWNRKKAAESLGKIGTGAEAAVPSLIKALKDENQWVREAAAESLGLIGSGNEAAVPALSESLADDDKFVRAKAATSLGQFGTDAEVAVPALINALKDKESYVRAQVAESLAKIHRGAEVAVPPFIKALQNGNRKDRRDAASLLGYLGPVAEPAVPALIDALTDNDQIVRANSAASLGKIGMVAEKTVPALIEALNDNEQYVRDPVARSLGKFGLTAVPDLVVALRKPPRIRQGVVLALGQVGAEAIPALIEALRDKDQDVRLGAGEALGVIGEPALPFLQGMLGQADVDPDPSVAFAIGQIMKHKAQEQLQARQARYIVCYECMSVEESGDWETHQAYYKVRVYYATDRKMIVTTVPSEVFGLERGTLSFGFADVSIPIDHRMGELEAPTWWEYLRLKFSPDPTKHVALLSVQPMERGPYFETMRSTIEQSPERGVFLFIHGYHTTFEDAARRTAQLAYDLNFQGVPVMYSWPSKGQFASYPADEATVSWTVTHLGEFLEALEKSSGAETIHLVAHSMGNRALMEALEDITVVDNTEGNPLFNQVVLTAPDIDRDVFLNLAKKIHERSDRITLYASSNDKALKASKTFHQYPRAGEAGEHLVVIEGVDTIDASQIDSSFIEHSYYSENRSVVTDLFQLFKHRFPPSKRAGLRSRNKSGLNYWEFKP